MARFTNQYRLEVPVSHFGSACMVGADIWNIRDPVFGPVSFHKFKNEFNTWQTMECQYPESITDADISVFGTNAIAWESKIYFELRVRRTHFLAELDTTTLKWRIVMESPYCRFLVHNDKVYMSNRDTLEIKSLETRQRTEVAMPPRQYRQGNSHDLVATNDSVFVIMNFVEGTRDVYQLIENRKRFLKVSKDNEPIRSYLINTRFNCACYVWTYQNRIYQSVRKRMEGIMTIDRFDFVTKEWITLYQTNLFVDWSFVCGTDTKIFVIEDPQVRPVLRIIDLKPSLKTLSLLSLSDHIVAYSDDEVLEKVSEMIGPVFGDMLRNMVESKRQDLAEGIIEGPTIIRGRRNLMEILLKQF